MRHERCPGPDGGAEIDGPEVDREPVRRRGQGQDLSKGPVGEGTREPGFRRTKMMVTGKKLLAGSQPAAELDPLPREVECPSP